MTSFMNAAIDYPIAIQCREFEQKATFYHKNESEKIKAELSTTHYSALQKGIKYFTKIYIFKII